MKSLIKKNQLMITALAIMIAIAGYLQFAGTGLEEEIQTMEQNSTGEDDTSPADSGGVITENYTSDGLLDLSEEDLSSGENDIESLDTDLDIITDNYLDTDMEVADASGTAEGETPGATPEEGEIPGFHRGFKYPLGCKAFKGADQGKKQGDTAGYHQQ